MMRKEPSEPRDRTVWPMTAQGLFGPARRRDEVKPSLKDLKGPWLARALEIHSQNCYYSLNTRIHAIYSLNTRILAEYSLFTRILAIYANTRYLLAEYANTRYILAEYANTRYLLAEYANTRFCG